MTTCATLRSKLFEIRLFECTDKYKMTIERKFVCDKKVGVYVSEFVRFSSRCGNENVVVKPITQEHEEKR